MAESKINTSSSGLRGQLLVGLALIIAISTSVWATSDPNKACRLLEARILDQECNWDSYDQSCSGERIVSYSWMCSGHCPGLYSWCDVMGIYPNQPKKVKATCYGTAENPQSCQLKNPVVLDVGDKWICGCT